MPSASTPHVRLTGVLDIGSSKIACAALAVQATGEVRCVGLGIRPAEGIKCGEVADPNLAEMAIVGAIADAERSAGARIEHLAVGLGCGRMTAVQVDLAVSLDPTIVQHADVLRLREGARKYAERHRRWSLLEEVDQFRLDGAAHVSPPIDRFGRKLEASMVMVTADSDPVIRLMETTERSGLSAGRLLPSPVAAGFAVSTVAERKRGITVVDLGAGMTSIVTFIDGRVARLETLTVGGRQLTQDVASALQIPFSSAERIKTECATVSLAHVAGNDAELHRGHGGFTADGQPAFAGLTSETRAQLCDILSPRLETVLRHVADHLDALPSSVADSGQLVLTGGGSLLAGLPIFAARLLGRQVRLGRPRVAAELGSQPLPSLAAVAGLSEMIGQGRARAASRARVRAA